MQPESNLSHINEQNEATMVDVASKAPTNRRALARGWLKLRPETIDRIKRQDTPKGEVFAVARIAGIMAAKRTSELIPLCHPIALTHVDVHIEVTGHTTLLVTATAEACDRTGVEMEAMTAVSVACLTVYDMLKGIDREIEISAIVLLKKEGGKSGTFTRTEP